MAHDFKCEVQKEGTFFIYFCKMTIEDKTYGLNLVVALYSQI